MAKAAVLFALTGLSAAACDNKANVTAFAATSINITPNPKTLAAGTTQQFTLNGTDPNGASVTVTPVWSVVSGGGTISSTGVFTAGTTPGTFANTILATSGTLSATATVTVTPGPIATITVTPPAVTLAINGTQTFVAVAKDAFGNIVTFTPTWTVVAGGGSIAATGVFTAGTTAGLFTNTVQASSGTIVGNATVTVLPGALASIVITPNPDTLQIGTTRQFVATGRDASGNSVVITPTFTVAASGGTITSAGLFTAGQTVGSFPNTVQATSGGISGAATVVVRGGPAATIVVTPNPASVVTGASVQFTATAKDANGNTVTIVPAWTVVNGGGTISATGLFTAGNTAGPFANTVKATSGTISGTATVNVTLPLGPLATITVTPNPGNVQPNASLPFTATGKDANGQIVSITPVWSATAGGTINPSTGVFTAGAATGTFPAAVRATSGTISGTADVIVGTVTPPPPGINLGSAATYGILAGTQVTCSTGGVVNADIGVSPGNTLTGFGPCVNSGAKNLGNPAAAQAQLDLTSAYNTLAGLPCPPANVISADLGGTTKAAGVYCSASSLGLTGNLTLDGGGDPNAVFVFQAGSTLTTAGNVLLINGAQAKNVYFQIGSSATLGTASQIQGNVIALASISLVTGANITGRALARNGAVTLGTNNTINLP